MGLRFCNGIRDNYSIVCNHDMFITAHHLLYESGMKYISILDNSGNYICSCYDDLHLDMLIKYCLILQSSYDALTVLHNQFPQVTIISFNEVSYKLYMLFKEAKCEVYCIGDLWEYFVDESNIVNKSIGFTVYTEGNLGIPISESGMWKNAFPLNEYNFLNKLYDDELDNHKIYNRNWIPNNQSNEILAQLILSGKPFMAARLGNTEAAICREYVQGYYTEKWLNWLTSTSGFFSTSDSLIADVDHYSRLTIEAVRECDINMCRFENEISIINSFSKSDAINVDWYSLYTDLNTNSWIGALKKKKVLVISSATETIKYQYQNRLKIFNGEQVLPEMELQYYIPPQTQLDNNVNQYEDWFDAFENMCLDISELSFDVAIIAAGAYGYPLAAFVKNKLKKQSIELCSGIYPIFGIKVKTQLIIRKVSSMYNDSWIFPIENKPDNYQKIEDGAYWG